MAKRKITKNSSEKIGASSRFSESAQDEDNDKNTARDHHAEFGKDTARMMSVG